MKRNIVIIGGGATGWMAAAFLKHRLGSSAQITVIESPTIPTVSVGESTNPITRRFHEFLGIQEREFMVASDASFKVAIRFEGFSAKNAAFYHPFGHPRKDCFRRRKADRYYATSHFSDWGVFGDVRRYGGSYGYQIDAALYADFLRNYAISRGVRIRPETVKNVEVSSDKYITKVNNVSGELFIDCTGFRSLLLSQALQVPFNPLNSHLLNDQAVAASVQYTDKRQQMVPFTRCTALSSGWVWDIPLWSRRGVGYVYSSSYLNQKQAESELLSFLDTSNVTGLRHINIRHGRHSSPWVGNCVALGLAWGFIEPLESTGLALTQLGIMDLLEYIDDPSGYCARTIALFDTTADFVLAHYILTARKDTRYWAEMEQKSTDSLRKLLSDPDTCLTRVTRERDRYYDASNWNAILSGMGYWDRDQEPFDAEVPVLDGTFLPHAEYVANMREVSNQSKRHNLD